MCIKYIIILLVNLTTCLGSHFRGAVFSWRPKDNLNEIEVLYRISWRQSVGHFCNESTISSGNVLTEGSLSCFKNCIGTIGDLNFFCTDFSKTEDWTTGRGSITYTFPSSNTYYEFGFTGHDLISLVSGGRNWELRVKANLAPRTDTWRVNSAPQVDISPIVRLIHGCHHTIWIPVSDPDGDEVRCRWANGTLNECASICNAFTGAVLNETTCTVTFDAIGSIGHYGVAIQVEDFTSGSTTPLSSVPIQFLVYVYNITSGCNSVTEFLPPTRPDRDTVIVNPNGTFTDVIVARSRISNTDIKEITTLSPSGLSKSVLMPHPTLPGAWYIEVTWNPTQKFSNQTYVFCFSATDKSGLTSEQRCMIIVDKNDINECDISPCENSANCTNVDGSYFCDCPIGWAGKNCSYDINECSNFPCINSGNCTNTIGSYACDCQVGFTGMNCTDDINECDISPCENSANCTNAYGTYMCNCPIGWTGRNCSYDINECSNFPCINGGNCTNTIGSYACDCQVGFTGMNCKDDVNECDSIPCQNGGTCTNTLGSYSCNFTPGWTGKNCSDDINECDSFPCQNGSNCTNTLGSFICHCQTGFTGQICAEDINECDFDPCENGGNCTNEYGSYFCNCTLGWNGKNCSLDVNECDSIPCKNGGTCMNTLGSYSCNCTPGWTGKNCSDDINECDSFPCQNGSNCTNTLGSFICHCQTGFTGKICAEDVNECDTSPCENDGTCINSDGSYFYKCSNGWDGKHCSEDIDECAYNPCEHGECSNTNTAGSYSCDCQIGWRGKSCADVQLELILPLILLLLTLLALSIFALIRGIRKIRAIKVSYSTTTVNSETPSKFNGRKNGSLGVSRPAPPIRSLIFNKSLLPEKYK